MALFHWLSLNVKLDSFGIKYEEFSIESIDDSTRSSCSSLSPIDLTLLDDGFVTIKDALS